MQVDPDTPHWEVDKPTRQQRYPHARALKLFWWGGAPIFVFLCLFLIISLLRVFNGEIATNHASGYLLWLAIVLAIMLVPGRVALMVTRCQRTANGVICAMGWFVLWVGLVFFIVTTPVDRLSEWPRAVATRISEAGEAAIASARERREKQKQQAREEELKQAAEQASAKESTQEDMDEAMRQAQAMAEQAAGEDGDGSGSAYDDVSVVSMPPDEREQVKLGMLAEATEQGLELYRRHRGAMEQLLQVGGIDPSWLKNKTQIERQLAATRSLGMVNQRMLEHLNSIGSDLETRMRQAGFTEEEIEAIAPADTVEASLGQVRQICDGLGQLLDDNRSALILLRQHWGLWQLTDGKVVWNREFYASERYERLRESIETNMSDIEGWHADLARTLTLDPQEFGLDS